MSTKQRRLAAVFFSDVKGFSSQMDADEEGTMDRLHRHNEVMRGHIDAHQGRVVKTVGDAFMAEFSSSVAAVACALDCQRTFATRNEEESAEDAIEVRIGVHVGDVIVDGDDLFGEAVNVAARLEAQAPTGAVCISEAVYSQVRRKVRARGQDRGPVDLKGIGESMRLYSLWPSEQQLDLTEVSQTPAVGSKVSGRTISVALLVAVAAVLGTVMWMGERTVEDVPSKPAVATTTEVPPPTPPEPAAAVASIEQEAPRRGGTLRMSWQGDWGDLKVPQTTYHIDKVAYSMLLDPLVRLTTSGQVRPWALERVAQSDDGKVLTLTLRKGVVFHAHPCLKDGLARPATAADLAASIELQQVFLDPLPVVGLAEFRAKKAEHIAGIRLTADNEVSIDLAHAIPYAGQLLHELDLVAKEALGDCSLPPPGTGPFAFAGPLQGDTLVVRRAKQYWGKPALLDAVELTAIHDEVGALAAMGRGELDLLGLFRSRLLADPRAEVPQLAARYNKLDVAVAPWVRSREYMIATIMFVVGVENQWSDAVVRQAVGYALDRRALLAVYPAPSTATGRSLHSRLVGADPAFEGFVHDPVRARELLAKAGYPGGKGLAPLRLAVKPDRREVAELIAKQLEVVGLAVNLLPVNSQGLARAFREHSLDAALVENTNPLIGNDPYLVIGWLPFYFRGQRGGAAGRMRGLVDRCTRELDRSRRADLYTQVEALLLEAPPYIPIAFRSSNAPASTVLSRKVVQGVIEPVTGRVDAVDWQELWPKLWLKPAAALEPVTGSR